MRQTMGRNRGYTIPQHEAEEGLVNHVNHTTRRFPAHA